MCYVHVRLHVQMYAESRRHKHISLNEQYMHTCITAQYTFMLTGNPCTYNDNMIIIIKVIIIILINDNNDDYVDSQFPLMCGSLFVVAAANCGFRISTKMYCNINITLLISSLKAPTISIIVWFVVISDTHRCRRPLPPRRVHWRSPVEQNNSSKIRGHYI